MLKRFHGYTKLPGNGLISYFIGCAPLILFLSFSGASIRNPPQQVQNQGDFRDCAVIVDHTVQGALPPPRTSSRTPGFATQDLAQARDSNAAQCNNQDMEATSVNQLRKECQGCSEARRPSCPAPRIQSSGAIVTSQPWTQLLAMSGDNRA